MTSECQSASSIIFQTANGYKVEVTSAQMAKVHQLLWKSEDQQKSPKQQDHVTNNLFGAGDSNSFELKYYKCKSATVDNKENYCLGDLDNYLDDSVDDDLYDDVLVNGENLLQVMFLNCNAFYGKIENEI